MCTCVPNISATLDSCFASCWQLSLSLSISCNNDSLSNLVTWIPLNSVNFMLSFPKLGHLRGTVVYVIRMSGAALRSSLGHLVWRRGLKRLENARTPNNHMKKTYYLMITINLVDLTKIITKCCIGTIFFINLIRAQSFIVWLHWVDNRTPHKVDQ